MGFGSGTAAGDSPVEMLMSIQAPFQVQMHFGMPAAGRARDLGRFPDAVRGSLDIIRLDQEAGHAILDYLAEPTAPERDDWSPARVGVSGSHAEGLVPFRRADNDSRTGHCRPHGRSRYSSMHRHTWQVTSGADLFSRVLRVVDVAVDVDPGSGGPGDVDRLGGALLGTQPAAEDSA